MTPPPHRHHHISFCFRLLLLSTKWKMIRCWGAAAAALQGTTQWRRKKGRPLSSPASKNWVRERTLFLAFCGNSRAAAIAVGYESPQSDPVDQITESSEHFIWAFIICWECFMRPRKYLHFLMVPGLPLSTHIVLGKCVEQVCSCPTRLSSTFILS